MNTMTLFLDFAVRLTAVLLAGGGFLLVLKKASAAERHLALTGVMMCAILLPLGLFALPRLVMKVPLPAPQTPIVQPATNVTPGIISQTETTTTGSIVAQPPAHWRITWQQALFGVLSMGLFVQVLWIGAGMISLRRVMRRAVPFAVADETALPAMEIAGLRRMPRVFLSQEVTVAFLGGWLKPGIVLPISAKTWPEEKMIMTLGHELAHLRRGDHWRLGVAALFRVLYWWHPLSHVLLRRWQCERERACDDMVLAGRVRPSDYAALLMEAASEGGKSCLPAVTLAMARERGVRERVEGVLRPALRRTHESWLAAGALFLLSAGLFWLGGATQLQAQEESTMYVEVGCPMVFEVDEDVYRKYQVDFDRAVATPGQAAYEELHAKVSSNKGVLITSQGGFMAREGGEGILLVGLRSDQRVSDPRTGLPVEREEETNTNLSLKMTPTLQDGGIRLEGVVEAEIGTGLGKVATETKKEDFSVQLQEKEMIGYMAPWPLTDGKGVQKRCFIFLQARSFPDAEYQKFLAESEAYYRSTLESDLGKVDLKNASVVEAIGFLSQQMVQAQLREMETGLSTWPWQGKSGGFTIAVTPPAGTMPVVFMQADNMKVGDFFEAIKTQTGMEYVYSSGTLTFQRPSDEASYSAEQHANLASQCESKEPDKALLHLRKAYEMKPDSIPIRVNLANLLVRQQQYAEAEGHFKELLKQDPKRATYTSAMYHVNYGVTLYFQDRNDEAIQQFEKALEIKPSFKDAKANLEVALNKKFGRTPTDPAFRTLESGQVEPLPSAHSAIWSPIFSSSKR